MAAKYEMFTTPRGVFIYPHLTEADTKFVKPDGEYHTKFALSAEESEPFIKLVKKVLKKYIKANDKELSAKKIKEADRNEIFETEVDDEGAETGRLIFKFKLKAKVETKNKSWLQQPRLFDSSAQPIKGEINIWTGSEGKVNVELFPYYMSPPKKGLPGTFGVSLRCIGAQILKLVEGEGRSAESMGFGAEDDGYTSAQGGFSDEDEAGGEDVGDDDEF
jgi:hypothetical protein